MYSTYVPLRQTINLLYWVSVLYGTVSGMMTSESDATRGMRVGRIYLVITIFCFNKVMNAREESIITSFAQCSQFPKWELVEVLLSFLLRKKRKFAITLLLGILVLIVLGRCWCILVLLVWCIYVLKVIFCPVLIDCFKIYWLFNSQKITRRDVIRVGYKFSWWPYHKLRRAWAPAAQSGHHQQVIVLVISEGWGNQGCEGQEDGGSLRCVVISLGFTDMMPVPM